LVGDTILAMLDGACHTTLVTDVAAALDALQSRLPVDVILLDCLMPGGGITRLLDEADALGLPVILTSGSTAEIERIGGSRPCLPKPFSAQELIDLLPQVALPRDLRSATG
jgi:CheY-like chemotaxis protein